MTAHPNNPYELLELADQLVRGAGPGRPKPVHLRRGVSTAYYALFHELAWRGTTALLQDPAGGWGPRSAGVSRWVTHTGLRDIADAVVVSSGRPALKAALGSITPDLVRISDALGTLQDARHSADYDDLYDLNRALAISLVETARDAVELSGRLVRSGDATYALFLRLMLGAAQAKSRRA